MKINHRFHLSGTVQFKITDTRTNTTTVRSVQNLVLNTGKTLLANILSGQTVDLPAAIAIGTGSTTPTGSNTALATELVRAAIETTDVVTVNVTDDAVQYTSTFAAGVGSGVWSEGGLSTDADGSGVEFARTLFEPFTKHSWNQVIVVWTIIIS